MHKFFNIKKIIIKFYIFFGTPVRRVIIRIFVAGLQQICDSYSLEMREYFFDRSPRNFDAVLGLYRNGKLHLAAGVFQIFMKVIYIIYIFKGLCSRLL